VAFDVYQTLAARLFSPSVLASPAEALAYLKNPVDPKSPRILVREWSDPPSTKKTKQDNQQKTATGKSP